MRSLRRIVNDQHFEIQRLNGVVLSYENQIHDLENVLQEQKQTSHTLPMREDQENTNDASHTEITNASTLLNTLERETSLFKHCAAKFKHLEEEFREKEADFKRMEAEFRQEEEKSKALELQITKCCDAVQQISSTISSASSSLNAE